MSARPIVVIGAGPAGCAAACALAAAGRQVVLLEREAAPAHKLCGEFLGGPALRALASLGLDMPALGAQPIVRVRLVRGGAGVERALPFPAAGFSRRALDAALRRRAVALGVALHEGVRVRAAEAHAVRSDHGALAAASVVLATGKHDLHNLRRSTGRPPDPMVGFKQHFRLSPASAQALRGRVELFLFRDGYAGLQMVEGGTANLCLLTRESEVFARRLDGARPCLNQPLAIARIPYGFLHRDVAAADGIFRVGDQMAVIPSFTGEGIAIALRSGMAAARAVLLGHGATAHHVLARRTLARPVRLAHAVYRVGSTQPGQRAIAAAARLPGALAAMALLTRVG